MLCLIVTLCFTISESDLTHLSPSLFVRAQITDCSQQTITATDPSVKDIMYREEQGLKQVYTV